MRDATWGLDEVVSQYLPWYDVPYSSETSPAITVRHLLQHTSGLPATIPGQFYEIYVSVNILEPLRVSQASFVYSPTMRALVREQRETWFYYNHASLS